MYDGTFDPGHGGRDPGAIGKGKTKEAAINLITARKVRDLLLPVMTIKLTRNDDIHLGNNPNEDLKARVDIANRNNSDIFVSFHCNSNVNASAHGAEVYTTRGETKADPLATAIINRMELAFPELTFRKDFADGDPDKEAGFYVIKNTKMPAVLIELAFISNPTEEALLNNTQFQDRAARAIADGICDYLGIKLPVSPSTKEKVTLNDVNVIVFGKQLKGFLFNDHAYVQVTELANAVGVTEPVIWKPEINTVVIG